MNKEELKNKINDLWEAIRIVPEDCKGPNNRENRMKYLKLRTNIYELKNLIDNY